MSAERKSYFQERTAKQILDMGPKKIYRARGLTNHIIDIDPSEDAVEIRTLIVPGQFYRSNASGAMASRKCYKHGDLIQLSQPRNQADALKSREIPVNIRERDFNKLRRMKEEDIYIVGYSFRPVQGRDRRKRVVPFVWVTEAIRLSNYAETMTTGMEVKPYADAVKVDSEGAEVVVSVPSRTKKKSRYDIKLSHVPVIPVDNRKAIVWSLNSTFETMPKHELYNIRYQYERDKQESDKVIFYPHDIAAYLATVKHFLRHCKNMTPMEMNPFPLISKKMAKIDDRLRNNMIIFDPSLKSKQKTRKLHIAERSILIARSIGVLGHDETMYWDLERDGKFVDYPRIVV
ncbi:MAG: hypothetical protein ABIA21_00690 [Candidatus Aenigmatarchaeota archaeon]